MLRLQFEDYFDHNYTKYTPEPNSERTRVDDSEQSYILRQLQEHTTNQPEYIAEVKRYLMTLVAILNVQCLRGWWKVHATEYPTLA